jgi:DNA-binding response OmpR family regulator
MRKILLVEDEPILRETYQMILSTQPYLCDVAENGKEALERCQSKNYDLILLDIMMPEMNGIEFLENIDKLDAMKQNIIVMSNLSSGKEIDRMRELGVHKSILKASTSPKELVSAIRYHFEE